MHDLLRGAAARFIAGFLLASAVALGIVALVQGPPRGFGFLFPMTAVGIVGGVLWVRRPPRFFNKTRTDYGSPRQ
jgi:hypothetical protein